MKKWMAIGLALAVLLLVAAGALVFLMWKKKQSKKVANKE